MTEPPAFLLQPKLIWIAILNSNYWLYDFDATSFHIFFFTILDIFLFVLVPFEIL